MVTQNRTPPTMMRIAAYSGKPEDEVSPFVLSEQEGPLHPDTQVHVSGAVHDWWLLHGLL